jgi:signal transduction histidine kinase
LEILDGGRRIAVLSFDAGLAGDDELLDLIAVQTRDALRRIRVTEQLANSRSRIALAAAQERARIERDLHDGPQQRLIALRVRLSIIEERLSNDAGAGERALHELGPEIDLALDELRALAQGIYPSALADYGLEAALRALALRSPVLVRVAAQGSLRHAADVESALYFTCVEALQNAIKHAHGATGVWISLREDRTLSLEVRDDGPGFVPRPAGFSRGLRNMADRMEAVGGRLTIDSEPGHGTSVVATVAPGPARAKPPKITCDG